MAIFHLSVQVIGRSAGRSAVAAAAYRAGDKLVDRETGITHDYTKKGGVAYSEIDLPANAPPVYADRETLWNAVQAVEKNKNAQLCREVEVALPKEFDRETMLDVLHDYISEQFVSHGMAADWSLHDKGDGNPHCHILLTMRGFKEDGRWDAKEKKIYKLDENGQRIPLIDKETGLQKIGAGNRLLWERETVQKNNWNDKGLVEKWRSGWAEVCNEKLAVIDVERIDHRSFERQGRVDIPTIHEGYVARQMEARGEASERCEYNRKAISMRGVIRETLDRIKDVFSAVKCEIEKRSMSIHERIEKLINRYGADRADHREIGIESGITGAGKYSIESGKCTSDTGERRSGENNIGIADRSGEIEKGGVDAFLKKYGIDGTGKFREAHDEDPLESGFRKGAESREDFERSREDLERSREEPLVGRIDRGL